MLSLLLAIASSSLIALLMRLSNEKIKNNIGMLAMNYMMCLALSVYFTGADKLFPQNQDLPQTFGMGAIHGMLYLTSFVMLNLSTQRNGVVLSSIFMKLGLLVPMVVSILIFGEMPTFLQGIGFFIAIAAIVLINTQPEKTTFSFNWLLFFLLLGGGSGDAMAKIFEELGNPSLAPQFLLYTFLVAAILCIGLMCYKKQHIGWNEAIFGAMIGIPNYFSAKFLLGALETLPAVITYPTYSVCTILVTTLAGVFFFKERLSKRQWIALGIILIAVALLNT